MRNYRRRQADPVRLFALAAVLVGLAWVIQAIVSLITIALCAAVVVGAGYLVVRFARPSLSTRAGDADAAGLPQPLPGPSAVAVRSPSP
jgi:hypothetical protein